MGLVEEASALKHTTKKEFVFSGPKSFSSGRSHGSFDTYRCNVFVCVLTCDATFLRATSHVPRVSHSLRRLSSSPFLIQAAVKSGLK